MSKKIQIQKDSLCEPTVDNVKGILTMLKKSKKRFGINATGFQEINCKFLYNI